LQAGWYEGPSLLQLLEALPAAEERRDEALLIPVQYVAREAGEGAGHQPRTIWGRIAHGRVRAGDAVQLLPSGEQAIVAQVQLAGASTDAAAAGQSAGLVLDRQLDVSRGDWIVTPGSARESRRFTATLAWLDADAAQVGRKYWLRHGNRWVLSRIASIESRLDIDSLQATDAHALAANDIGHVIVETQSALPLEPYAENRVAGALIVVDAATNRTSGALLVKEVH
jgi:sulfate adenylyltransferase subunit 1